jgi:hypothetical protein
MRFMILRKADPNTESGKLPPREVLAAMGKYREAMVEAGVILGGDGLQSSAAGARVRCSNGKMTVTDGPFTEAKELIAGYVLIEVATKEEAIEWAKRCPTMGGPGEVEIEVRQVIEASDFPEELTPELANLPWTTVADEAAARLRPRAVRKR